MKVSKMGRPKIPKREHTIMASFRLKPETIAEIDALAKKWSCTKSEAIRRAIKDAKK